MIETNLELEGKCLLNLTEKKDQYLFTCNGFNVLKTLLSISDIDKIIIEELFFDLGEGETYKSYSLNETEVINTFKGLTKKIEEFVLIHNPFFINTLIFKTPVFKISIFDGREFVIEFEKDSISDLKAMIVKLIEEAFDFSEKNSLNIFYALKNNLNKEVLINTDGEIQGIYKDFDEYLSIHRY
ncbi:hypothetical protein [Flavobacterium sp.]|uniref:hypothetical protein n=1 Tax=Flavobacterium sp. TaxID=239 RepID=UPI00374DF42D